MVLMLILLLRLLRRRQGGPWAPPPCGRQIPRDVYGSVVCFSVQVLVFVFWLFVLRFCLWGWYLLWILSPSSPDPCLAFCMCPSSFLVPGWFRRRRVFSFLLFLSGAGETQTPFGGFGVPLVFSSSRTRSPTSTRTACSTPYTTATPRTCFLFFFPFRRRRSLSVLGVSWFCPWVGRFLGCVLGPSLGACVQDDTNAFGWGIG